jgi:hypothetical protein
MLVSLARDTIFVARPGMSDAVKVQLIVSMTTLPATVFGFIIAWRGWNRDRLEKDARLERIEVQGNGNMSCTLDNHAALIAKIPQVTVVPIGAPIDAGIMAETGDT